MAPALRLLQRFLNDECGQTAIEYGLILLVIGVAIIGSVQYFGESMGGVFNSLLPAFAF